MKAICRQSTFWIAAALGWVLAAVPAHAQRIGVEAGVSAVEGLGGPSPTMGIAVSLPLAQRFRAAATYSRWTGLDPTGRAGNQSVDVVGLFRVRGRHGQGGADLGGGVGWFEMGGDGGTGTNLEPALALAGELRTPVALNSSAYLRANAAIHTGEASLRWASIRLGIDVGLF
ncbi:hypothetical protein BH23GEM6_BH23GEM6_08710 [soil metagenome]